MNIGLDKLVEMVENQLVLSEQDNVQSIYKTSVKLRTNNSRAGETTQILNEIRGIAGVTTVIHLSDYARKTDTFNFVMYEIKFELVGKNSNPITYLKKTLVPGIRDIQGIDIQDIQSRPEKLS
tara:strand:- start:524 stop:892 length:369 start_codon:yes stop_codon:yes gene_type:complete